MPISIVDMLLVYSGPAVNTPIASIGGAVSTDASKEVRGQTGTGLSTVTGVTIVDAYGNLEGVGILSWDNASNNLLWLPPGASVSSGATVTADGTYTVGNAAGYLIVDVVQASLPGANAQDSITMANILQNIFDDVSGLESLDGNIEYRCFYILNNHATSTAFNTTIWVAAQPSVADVVSMALDPIGKNGVAIGPLANTEDTTNLLSGLTFTLPSTAATGLAIGTLEAGAYYPFWVKKETPVENRLPNPSNSFDLGLYITAV